MADTMHEQLTKYLTDAHSIEEQALAQLRSAPDAAGDPELAGIYREHLAETEGHERRVRELLEARDAKPSTTKDTLMKLGGKGFLLFARLQPDTPGKLHAHSLSYEALELSSYELLRGTAQRAYDHEVVAAADRIADEEQTMMERLEATFDAAVQASLRDVPRDDLDEQLRKYLADAHAIEKQAETLLEKGPKLAGTDTLAHIYEEHLAETRDHAEAVEERLQALGGDPSSIKDAAMRLGALNWGAFFQGHPDTPRKAGRVRTRVRVPRGRRLRAAEARREAGRRRRDGTARRADPRAGARGGEADRERVRRGRGRQPRGRRGGLADDGGDGVLERRVHLRRDVDRPRVRRRSAGVDDHGPAERARVPRLHRRPLVGSRERGEHRVAGGDLLEVALDDLRLVPLRPAAEVAAHRVDRLAPRREEQLGRAAPVLVRERRPGQVDALHGGVQYVA